MQRCVLPVKGQQSHVSTIPLPALLFIPQEASWQKSGRDLRVSEVSLPVGPVKSRATKVGGWQDGAAACCVQGLAFWRAEACRP